MLNGLDLFSGIGGIAAALEGDVRPVAYCEIDPYCQSVLLQRMQEGNLPKAPIWDDISSFPTSVLGRGSIDIFTAGFPCQDISVAGKGKGLGGERSGLFFEIMRLAEEIKPKFIFLENVPAITTRGGLRVVREIASLGYDCRWCVISAASVGALHKRERWFLLAHSKGEKPRRLSIREEKRQSSPRICGQYETVDEWKEAVSTICRVTDGIPNRVERLRSLGNSVVPQQVRKAFDLLTKGCTYEQGKIFRS